KRWTRWSAPAGLTAVERDGHAGEIGRLRRTQPRHGPADVRHGVAHPPGRYPGDELFCLLRVVAHPPVQAGAVRVGGDVECADPVSAPFAGGRPGERPDRLL